MKKVLLFCLFFCLPTSLYANTGSVEEDKCFNLLNTAISNDVRFNNNGTKNILINGDLSDVLYDEANSSYADFSTYSNFLNNIVDNPNSHEGYAGLTKKDFVARRNNIGTIIASGPTVTGSPLVGGSYVISNIVGFGKDSNFTFPLDSRTTPYGDRYKLNGNWFKEYVLYTHHNFEGDFMSCGIVKIKPLGGRNFTNISQGGYKTNILNSQSGNCSSGFEGSKTIKDGLEYYKLKSNVCVVDYNDDDYLKMEVISVAYNNGSDYMNEFITHQLQVKAMDDMGNNAAGGLKGIADKFMEYLDSETCLKVIHGDVSNLPTSCNGSFGSELVYNKGRTLLSYIFDSAYARRDGLHLENEIKASSGLVAYGSIPYNVYKKINLIEDKTFRSYLILSVLPNLEELIQNRKKNNIELSPYEKVFLKCGMKYEKRSSILQDFVNNIKDFKKIDYKNLTYSDAKFGDCIIPYPDKRNLKKEINISFSSNKLLAKKMNGTYKSPDISNEMQKYVENIRKSEIEYNNKINKISKDFNDGKINTSEFNRLISLEKENFNKEKKILDEENNNLNKEIREEVNNLDNAGMIEKNIEDKKMNLNTVLFILLLVLLGGGILFFSIKKNNN